MEKTNIPEVTFKQPTSDECRLIHNDECSSKNGCPLHPGSSCAHGIEGQVCEYAMNHKKKFEEPKSDECQIIHSNECSSENGCPLHPGSSCCHGIEGYVCEHGMT